MLNTIANADIRSVLKESNIKHWELAEQMQISETTLVRKLRRELSNKEKTKINSIIDKLIKEKKED